MKLDVNA